jgi:hypothetical protein
MRIIGVRQWAIACGLLAGALSAIGVTIVVMVSMWKAVPSKPAECGDRVFQAENFSSVSCEPNQKMEFVQNGKYVLCKCKETGK